ncbi:hypothetical protein SUGI_0206100 [Cryptomeria japonica]|nr:hypothetical protein SUGI_0206100 [Cryptomeria japonica]
MSRRKEDFLPGAGKLEELSGGTRYGPLNSVDFHICTLIIHNRKSVIHGFDIKNVEEKRRFLTWGWQTRRAFLPGDEKMMRATLASQRSESSLAFFNSPILPWRKSANDLQGPSFTWLSCRAEAD